MGAAARRALPPTAWSAAKAQAVATLTASPYAAAKIAQSEAFIDPERFAADLSVELESGPAFRFGPLEITGLSRYPESLVRNFSTVHAGEPYDDRELAALRPPAERVRLLRERAGGDRSRSRARRRRDGQGRRDRGAAEAARRRARLLDRREFRANASYRDVNVDGRGLQMLPRDASRRSCSRRRCASRSRRTTRMDRHVERGRGAHRHRGPHHAHGRGRHALAHGRGAQRTRALRDVLPGRAAARGRPAGPGRTRSTSKSSAIGGAPTT